MKTYRIHDNVSLGESCSFGDYAVVGLPPRGVAEGELETKLGRRVQVQSHVIISAGNVFGDDCAIGHGTFMRHNNRFGDRVQIGANNVIERDNLVGDDVVLETHSGLAELTIVERGVWIGPHVSMASVLHPLCPKASECTKGPHLYRGVTVDAAVTIFPGIRIGEGAYIEPGTIVMQDVRPYTVVGGSYGKSLGDVFDLYPKRLERLTPFVDLSPAAIAKARSEFDAQPSFFPLNNLAWKG